MRVAIIKYNAGNIFSVDCAMRRLGIEAEITGDAERILSADKVIFPGVGEAETTMAYLREHRLDEVIKSLRQPTLGICIGMQLMCKSSEEAASGKVECLGIFDAEVRRFEAKDASFKVPHMGWNTVNGSGELFCGLGEEPYFYYVHSYYATPCADTIATTEYMHEYSAALGRDNFYAVQFHPEKSGVVGERLLNNFLQIK